MTYTQTDLLKLTHDTKAVSIWDCARGPVFWYAANVPGPFYFNTELMIGREAAEKMLREITAIVAGTADAQARAQQLEGLVMEAYKTSPVWQNLIAGLIAAANENYPRGTFQFVSGGERRDFLFSIPFAHAYGLPHLYLFKNKDMHCAQPVPAQAATLHVSDLINNAASILDQWLPILGSRRIACVGNLCVTIRGDNGLRRLREAGQKAVSLITVDIDFFRHLRDARLIDQATFEEISVFFGSAADWAARYLIGRPELFDAAGCDAKSFERLRAFIANDPWHLRPAHEAFFAAMQKAIDQRLSKAA